MLIILGGIFRKKVLIFNNFSIYKIIRKVQMSQQFCPSETRN